MADQDYDVIIIGSGILGSALAHTLAKQNRRVVVLERDLSQPNRIVGELLQPGGRIALNKLGMSECLEGFDGQNLRGFILRNPSDTSLTHLEYHNSKEDDLHKGFAFHHGRFVMALRQAAMKQQGTTYIEATAKDLITENGVICGVKYSQRESVAIKELRAPLTIVADGCFSKFRTTLVSQLPTVDSHFACLYLKNCPETTPDYAELCLAEPSPVIIFKLCSEDTRCFIDIKGVLPKDINAYLIEKVAPKIPFNARKYFIEAAKANKARYMPNRTMPAFPIIQPGVICMGDALNMRHPVTGSGMTVAFKDVVLFRDLFADLSTFKDHKAVKSRAKMFYSKRQSQHTFVVNILSHTLYKIFSADDRHLLKLKESCFECLKYGDKTTYASTFISLFSITDSRPKLLIMFLLNVILYSIYLEFTKSPWWAIYRTVPDAVAIIFKSSCIVLPLLWAELKSRIS